MHKKREHIFLDLKLNIRFELIHFHFFPFSLLGKHRKLIQADETDLEEAETIASQSTTNQNQRDIEAGRKRN